MHILTLTFTLCGVRIDRMMSYHYHPIFFRTAQLLFQPHQLLLRILLRHGGVVERVFVVLTYQRGGVDEDDAQGSAVFLKELALIARRHLPSAAHIGIIQHRLRIPSVLVVAEDGIPRNLQFGMAVYEFVVGHP